MSQVPQYLLGHVELAQGNWGMGKVWAKQTPNFILAEHRENRAS